jgi:hypothetical protein
MVASFAGEPCFRLSGALSSGKESWGVSKRCHRFVPLALDQYLALGCFSPLPKELWSRAKKFARGRISEGSDARREEGSPASWFTPPCSQAGLLTPTLQSDLVKRCSLCFQTLFSDEKRILQDASYLTPVSATGSCDRPTTDMCLPISCWHISLDQSLSRLESIDAPAAIQCRYQYDTLVVGSCFHRNHPRLCRN